RHTPPRRGPPIPQCSSLLRQATLSRSLAQASHDASDLPEIDAARPLVILIRRYRVFEQTICQPGHRLQTMRPARWRTAANRLPRVHFKFPRAEGMVASVEPWLYAPAMNSDRDRAARELLAFYQEAGVDAL